MTKVKALKATARSRAGTGAARAVRREGRVPGVVYGDGAAPLPISLDFKELRQNVFAGHFLTSIYELEVDGARHRVIPRDYQLDPVRDVPIHVDFLRLGEGARIRVRIPVHVKNADQAPGVKRGGTVNIVEHSVEVLCLADAIPRSRRRPRRPRRQRRQRRRPPRRPASWCPVLQVRHPGLPARPAPRRRRPEPPRRRAPQRRRRPAAPRRRRSRERSEAAGPRGRAA